MLENIPEIKFFGKRFSTTRHNKPIPTDIKMCPRKRTFLETIIGFKVSADYCYMRCNPNFFIQLLQSINKCGRLIKVIILLFYRSNSCKIKKSKI